MGEAGAGKRQDAGEESGETERVAMAAGLVRRGPSLAVFLAGRRRSA